MNESVNILAMRSGSADYCTEVTKIRPESGGNRRELAFICGNELEKTPQFQGILHACKQKDTLS